MVPGLQIPTDNIYKFVCIFGLSLIISAIVGSISTYNSSLEKVVNVYHDIIVMESKIERNQYDEALLKLDHELIELTNNNLDGFNYLSLGVCAFGVALSWYGLTRWLRIIQTRDNKLADLQAQKLELEIEKLALEVKPARQMD